jgi:hypothetical protein
MPRRAATAAAGPKAPFGFRAGLSREWLEPQAVASDGNPVRRRDLLRKKAPRGRGLRHGALARVWGELCGRAPTTHF